jgi:4-amino-4-deoxy-L-arabinose transferase-like glycosyltransferase
MSAIARSFNAEATTSRPGSAPGLHPEDRLGQHLQTWSPKKQFWALLMLCGLSFFVHLSAFEVDLMEARNLVTAREMVSEGSWLVPTMNGELRIAKPPLPSWITAAVYALGGHQQNEGLLRIPAALMATLMVISVWGLVRGLSRDPLLPLKCAAVLATSLILLDLGRRNTWDIYSHAFMAAAMWAFVGGLRSSDRAWWNFLGVGILLAAAFMSKGPVPFYALLLPFLVAYGTSYGVGELRRSWRPLALGLAVFALLSAAWPLYLLNYHPAMVQQVFSQETAAWGGKHVRPLYFYLHFPLYAGIWFPGVLAGLWPRIGKRHIAPLLRYRFVIAWLIGNVLLLSIIPEKKERYLLPAGIPMAILAGCFWRSLTGSGPLNQRVLVAARFLKGHAALILLLILAAQFLLFRGEMMIDEPRPMVFIVSFGVFLGLLVPCYRLFRQPRASALFVATLGLSCALIVCLLPAVATSPLYIRNYSYQPLDEARELAPLHTYDIYQAGPINMKDVWKVGGPIHAWSGIQNKLEEVDLPVVLMSEGNPGKHLPKKFEERIRLESLGCYRSDYRHADKTKCFALVTSAELSAE